MTSRVVYRIQDADGRGPWRPGFSQRWVEDRPEVEFAVLKPWPLEFGPVHLKSLYGMHLGCGCVSIEQLRRWFTQTEYERLRSFGYRAVRMRVGRVLAESDIQCVFERSKPLSVDVELVELYQLEQPA